MICDCDCHKNKAWSDLKKCQETNKKKTKEITKLQKKLLAVTIAVAIGGTLVGKEILEDVLKYFETFDKVKQTIERVDGNDIKYSFPPHAVYGSSPSPGTLGLFALAVLIPTTRRK